LPCRNLKPWSLWVTMTCLIVLLSACTPDSPTPLPSPLPATAAPLLSATPPLSPATATAVPSATAVTPTAVSSAYPPPATIATPTLASSAYPPPATIGATPAYPEPARSPSVALTATQVSERPPTPLPPATQTPALLPTSWPEGIPTIVPIMYEMHDWENNDFQHRFPDWGPLGSWMWWSWAQLEPQPGQYNWGIIDAYLEQAAKYTVTLVSGEVIPKPVAISIEVYPDWGMDATPQWVYERFIPAAPLLGGQRVGWVVDPDGAAGPCVAIGMPRWGDATWERRFDEFVMALGQRYDKDLRVNSVWIATGLYGETIEEKTLNGCRYELAQGPNLAYWVLHLMDTYRQAFPSKPLFVINSGGWSIRRETAARAASLQPPVGLKLNVLAPDLSDAYGYKSLTGGGKIEVVNRYSDTLPIAFEHAFPPRPADAYWSIMNALAHRAVLLDFNYPDMFEVIKSVDAIFPLWHFVDTHLGRAATTTPDVWILLRETQHPASLYQGWSSGEYGDWHFFLTRPEGIPENGTVAITDMRSAEIPAPARSHIYGAHSTRRTDEASGNRYMSFDVDNRYPFWGQKPLVVGGDTGYRVEVVLLNKGNDQLSLEYKNAAGEWVTQPISKGPALGPVDDWVTVTWTLHDAYMNDALPGGADFRLDCMGDGDEYIHRVRVEGFRWRQ